MSRIRKRNKAKCRNDRFLYLTTIWLACSPNISHGKWADLLRFTPIHCLWLIDCSSFSTKLLVSSKSGWDWWTHLDSELLFPHLQLNKQNDFYHKKGIKSRSETRPFLSWDIHVFSYLLTENTTKPTQPSGFNLYNCLINHQINI